jgi:hypothetical protein
METVRPLLYIQIPVPTIIYLFFGNSLKTGNLFLAVDKQKRWNQRVQNIMIKAAHNSVFAVRFAHPNPAKSGGFANTQTARA